MRTLVVSLVIFAATLHADKIHPLSAPIYSTASIVNAASNQAGPLAPNTIVSLYGAGLAYGTKALTADDIRGGTLPTAFPGTGVRVTVGNVAANLYYVSPTQINFLVPATLLPGNVIVKVVLDSLDGPLIPIQLAAAAPALFQLDVSNAVATRPDGSVITPDVPARPGDLIILYATGLGQTVPPVVYGQLPNAAALLKQIRDFRISLDGVDVNTSAIAYAGIAPGFAGLYQINVRLPSTTGANPEIRIGLGDALSPESIRLPVQP
jgi:uncharacterized protein (TIGR03437 family)